MFWPSPLAGLVSARVHCPRRRVEPCGNRALRGGASASPLSSAAACSVRLSSCCNTDRRMRPRLTTASSLPACADGLGATLSSVALPSQLVRYQSASDRRPRVDHHAARRHRRRPRPRRRRRPPRRPTVRAVVRRAGVGAGARRPRLRRRPPRTTRPAPAAATDGERGQATWYAAAPPGMCASPTLPVRDGLDGDERRHRRQHDVHRR